MLKIDIHGLTWNGDKLFHIATGLVQDNEAFDHFLYMLDNPNGYDTFGTQVLLAETDRIVLNAAHHAYIPRSFYEEHLEALPTPWGFTPYSYAVSFARTDVESRHFMAMHVRARTLMLRHHSSKLPEDVQALLYGTT